MYIYSKRLNLIQDGVDEEVLKDYMKQEELKEQLNNYITKNDVSNFQKYKLTKDNGQINYITTDGNDITQLAPGNYSCIASRFINPPIPGDSSYIDVEIRENQNDKGIRRVITVHYIYAGRTFTGFIHHNHGLQEWIELTDAGHIKNQIFLEEEKLNFYKKLRSVQTETSKTISFITDTHYTKNSRIHHGVNGLRHMQNIVEICGNGLSDMIIHGGDVINGMGSSNYLPIELMDANKVMLSSNIPAFICKGNHDIGLSAIPNVETSTVYSTPTWEECIIDNVEWHKLITQKYVDKYNLISDDNNPGAGYAYYDFPDVKLRVIMIDVLDLPKGYACTDVNNPDVVSKDTSSCFIICQKQFDWLLNKALNFDSDNWNILFFSHIGMYDKESRSRVYNGDHLHNIFKAINNSMGVSANNNAMVNPYGVTFSADFLDKHHKVIGYVSGHMHADYTFNKDGIQYIYCKQSACAFHQNTDPEDKDNYRTLMSAEHEDSWTSLTIDVESKILTVHRFGSGKNFEFAITWNNF